MIMVAMEVVVTVVATEAAEVGTNTSKVQGEWIYFVALLLITAIPYACSTI